MRQRGVCVKEEKEIEMNGIRYDELIIRRVISHLNILNVDRWPQTAIGLLQILIVEESGEVSVIRHPS
jgi:hypothetical protein